MRLLLGARCDTHTHNTLLKTNHTTTHNPPPKKNNANRQVARGGFMVLRPDSGDPVEVVLMALRAAERVFGADVNSKGFKVLRGAGVIQGDGIDLVTLKRILRAALDAGYSAANVAFGMGGGLLQKVNRDTMSFATKLSRIEYADGSTPPRDVMKHPKTDAAKFSLPGVLAVKRVGGVPTAFPADSGEVAPEEDLLQARAEKSEERGEGEGGRGRGAKQRTTRMEESSLAGHGHLARATRSSQPPWPPQKRIQKQTHIQTASRSSTTAARCPATSGTTLTPCARASPRSGRRCRRAPTCCRRLCAPRLTRSCARGTAAPATAAATATARVRRGSESSGRLPPSSRLVSSRPLSRRKIRSVWRVCFLQNTFTEIETFSSPARPFP